MFLVFKMLKLNVHFPFIFCILLFLTKCRAEDENESCGLINCLVCSCDLPSATFADGINLIYYNSINATTSYPITNPTGLCDVLDKNKRTIFFIPGYTQSPTSPDVKNMIEALCDGNTNNVVVLDWSKYSSGLYPAVFGNAEKVGAWFANSIKQLVETLCLDISKIYIIGFSIGAHIAGIVGKCNGFVIPRITALDPANPVLYPMGCYLTYKDAKWVDVIHTDMLFYGAPPLFPPFTLLYCPMGTAEYFVNGGFRYQPKCDLTLALLTRCDFCSHAASLTYYANTKTGTGYNAVNCYNASQCVVDCVSYASNIMEYSNNGNNVGYYASSNATGYYIVFTGKPTCGGFTPAQINSTDLSQCPNNTVSINPNLLNATFETLLSTVIMFSNKNLPANCLNMACRYIIQFKAQLLQYKNNADFNYLLTLCNLSNSVQSVLNPLPNPLPKLLGNV